MQTDFNSISIPRSFFSFYFRYHRCLEFSLLSVFSFVFDTIGDQGASEVMFQLRPDSGIAHCWNTRLAVLSENRGKSLLLNVGLHVNRVPYPQKGRAFKRCLALSRGRWASGRGDEGQGEGKETYGLFVASFSFCFGETWRLFFKFLSSLRIWPQKPF